ncbi:hypothetical protein EDD36DRAFT_312828 [Exophiala viscosa]|uniref:Peptidase A2 domain-containing protein n=1 Tax=Exophiala viscosa TaxID=2486360 RepID=A0AAN6DR22_9EURO|nr:hypothetical protein EDD36DRAFT_312828 [Exophiala viscosa]
MVAIGIKHALDRNEYRTNAWTSREFSMRRAGATIAWDILESGLNSRAVDHAIWPPEPPCCQSGEANGAGNKTDTKEANVVEEARDVRILFERRLFKRPQRCEEGGPMLQACAVPNQLPPVLHLKSDGVVSDASVESGHDTSKDPVVNVLARLSLRNNSPVHPAYRSADRPPQKATRSKQQSRIAKAGRRTHTQPSTCSFETRNHAARIAARKALKRDLSYPSSRNGENVPLTTLLDTGADYSVACRRIVTQGDAEVHLLATPFTLTSAFGNTVTITEFARLNVSCGCSIHAESVSIDVLLLDDDDLSGYDAYLCAFDLIRMGHMINVPCEDLNG